MSLDRFEHLYERYSDGTLSPAEREEYLSLMADSSVRTRFVELSAFEATASEEARLGLEREEAELERSKEDHFAPATGRSERNASSRRILVVRLRSQVRAPSVWGAGLAAAGLLFACGLLLLVGTGGESRAIPKLGSTRSRVSVGPDSVPRGESRFGETSSNLEAIRKVERPSEPLHPPVRRELSREEPPPTPPPDPALLPREPSGLAETRPSEALPPREPATIPSIAHLVRSQGQVWILVDGARKPAEAGQGFPTGQGIAVGPDSSASLKFPDGTAIDLGSDTELVRVAEGPGGKLVQLGLGFITVVAARQPPTRPLVFISPHSEATVLGTEFTLYSTPTFTRLDVREGRVKFLRLPGITSITVKSGHYALAGAAYEFAAKAAVSLWRPSVSGLQLWLRADAGVKGPENGVSLWKDQSPSGNDATQPDVSCQPIVVPNAIGGRPALRFDGANAFLLLPAGFSDFKAGLTAFVVVKVGSTPLSMHFLDLDTGPTCDNICFARKDTPDKLAFWAYSNCLTKGKVEAPGGILLDQFQSLSVVDAPLGRVTLYRNGALLGAGVTAVARDVARKPNFLGKSNTSGDPFFKGDLCEVILYNRALSDAERLFVEAYLNTKYFDPTSPPVLSQPVEK